ncbi:MAG: DUF1761 domain-containing protein [Bacteroidota bacterium]
MEEINWLSIAIASITPALVGAIWYSKFLFGPIWINDADPPEQKRSTTKVLLAVLASFLVSLVLSFVLLNFNNSPADQDSVAFDTFQHGAWHGAFIGLIVIAPVLILNGLLEVKNWKRVAINLGYWVVSLMLMGGVLDAMNHWG